MRQTRRISAFASSLLIHTAVISFLVWVDVEFPSSPRPRYTVIPFPRDLNAKDKVPWFKPRQPVPEVSPEKPFGPSPVPQGQKDPTGRVLIVQSPNPVSRKQLIREPDHPEPLPKDVPAPNVIVVHGEEPKPVPKPAPRAFVRPPSQVREEKVAELADSPPPSLDKPLPSPNLLGAAALNSAIKLPPKAFVMPPRASGTGSSTAAANSSSMLAPPSLNASGNSASGAETVILGLDPAAQLPPRGSRSGQFAQAPNAGTPSSGAGTPGAPTVAGVVAHGRPGAPGISPPAPQPRVPSAENRTLRQIVSPPVGRTMSAPLRPSSRIIPASVEAIFAKRDVYTLVIPAPNLPDYPGDWIMWFAERQPPEGNARISAPIPARKYTWNDASPLGAGAPETALVQFAATIDRSGRLTGIRVLRSMAAEPFRRRAVDELQLWEFRPALRNMAPVDVDVVLELKLQLRPEAQP